MTQVWKPVKRIAEGVYGAFGVGDFGRRAESFARFFGTPTFLIVQSVFVLAWIVANAIAVAYRWDPYPFILLNLMFSLQAAYAAPLILLAQTRQADRDRIISEADQAQRAEIAQATIANQDAVLELVRQLLAEIDQNQTLLAEMVSQSE